MRKLKSFWALLCLLLVSTSASFAASDDDGFVGSNGTWRFTASTGKLTINCTGSMGSDNSWRSSDFFSLSDIKSVAIGAGVTDIAANAFLSCTNLTSVTFSTDSKLTTVGAHAFQNTGITSITLPSSVKTIGDDAFYASKLTSFTVPSSCTSIGVSAVSTGTITKFYSASTSFGVGNNNEFLVRKSDGNLISGSATLTVLDLSNTTTSVKKIGDYAFYQNKVMTTIMNGASLTSVGGSAFGSKVLKSMSFNGPACTFTSTSFDSGNKSTCIATCKDSETVTNLGKYITQTYSSKIGDNLQWRVWPDQSTLTIWGSSAMTNFASSSSVPWNAIKSQIKTINIESANVTTIGNYAFYGMGNLTTIQGTVSGITSIGTSAFENCTKLATVPFSSMTALKTIGTDAFYAATGFTTLNLSSCTKLTTIGLRAFSSTAITSVTLPTSSSLVTLGENCFSYTKLTTFKVPSYVTSMGASILHANSALTSITGPASGTYTVTGNAIYKGNVLLQGCKNTVVKSTTTEIAAHSFHGSGIQSITFPATLTTIASTALADATLTSIIDQRTDASKVTFTSGYFNSTTKSSCKVQVTSADIKAKYTDAKFTAANVMVTTCGTNLTWSFDPSTGKLTISGAGTAITSGTSASSYPWDPIRTQIKEVQIPTSVTKIPDYAFDGCTALNKIHDGGGSYFDKVTSIGKYAFRNTAFTQFNVPDGLNTLDEGAFYGCSKLTSMSVYGNNNYFTTVNNCLMSKDKTKLYLAYAATITVPSTCTSISNSAFSTGIVKTLTIPASVGSIGSSVFSGASSITTLNYATAAVPSGYGSLSKTGCTVHVQLANQSQAQAVYKYFKTTNSFSNVIYDYCGTNLTWSVSSKKLTVTKVNEAGSTGAMWNFTSSATAATLPWYSSKGTMTSVAIGSGVTTVGDYAFQNCTAITSVTIPNTVTMIGAGAFSGATKLASVTLPAALTSIGENAFQSTAIKSLSIPATVTVIGAFGANSIQTIKVDPANTKFTSQDKSGKELNMLLTKDGKSLFLCPATTGNVTLPSTLTEVKAGAFNGAVGKLTIPAKVTTMSAWPTSATSIHAANEPTSAATVPSTLKSVKVYASTAAVQEKYKALGFTNVVVGTSYSFENGVLTIVGSGAVSSAPWLSDANIGAAKIKRVVVEPGITSLCADAFLNCTNLVSAKLPEGLTNMGNTSFNGCTSLKSIVLPSTVAQTGDNTSHQIFYNSGVESIKIAEGPDYSSKDLNGNEINAMWYQKEPLKALRYSVTPNIGSYVWTVGPYAVKTQSVEDLNIPANIINIYPYAFANLDIKNIYSASTATIPANAFNATIKTKAKVYVASDAIKAKFVAAGFTEANIKVATGQCGDDMYYYVNGKKLIIFGGGDMYESGLTWAGGATAANAFTSIQFVGNAINTIGKNAFSACTAVKGEIVIPASVTKIGAGAFGSTLITSVVANGQKPASMAATGFTADVYAKASLVVPDDARDSYLEATGWENFGGVQTNEEVANPYDLNKDGRVNSSDVTLLFKQIK